MAERPNPADDAARIFASWPDPLRLVLDTNVWLQARETLGYDPATGALQVLEEHHLANPAVAVLRAQWALDRTLSVVVDDVLRGELFDKLRGGYEPYWAGTTAPAAARLLTDLLALSVPPLQRELSQPPAVLPDPPLSERELHDRQFWAQTVHVDGLLVTSDGPLLDAIWEVTGSVERAMRPDELIELLKNVPPLR